MPDRSARLTGVRQVSLLSKIAYVVGLIATVFYGVLTWYAGNLFGVMFGLEDGVAVSNFSIVAIAPLDLPLAFNMMHWQLLAAVSFAFSLFIALKNKAVGDNSTFAALPLAGHYGVLLLLLMIHMVGFLLPLVPDCATIK